ncbi:phage tail tube protein [Novosphingobium sp. fls2-241-R2A-195]|uniref:phage tail tube protein n=1 Tax=Novosphingobium sp. fls2-241-R2A-195 TaxID=3040296 RepID=UPI0025500977|nr:phage tail tube protein [Novosphingobium sp. fls2-241-R2A-195]
MATDAQIGMGAAVSLDNASGSLTLLGEPITITLPNPQVADVEATHFGSPNRRREYIAGLIEDGEVTFGFNYVPGGPVDVLIMAAIEDGVARTMQVDIPRKGTTAYRFSFEVIVKGWEKTVPLEDRLTAVLTARVTGPVTAGAVAP